jgi:hypothetical protein
LFIGNFIVNCNDNLSLFHANEPKIGLIYLVIHFFRLLINTTWFPSSCKEKCTIDTFISHR